MSKLSSAESTGATVEGAVIGVILCACSLRRMIVAAASQEGHLMSVVIWPMERCGGIRIPPNTNDRTKSKSLSDYR
jgi:hypothetical protein